GGESNQINKQTLLLQHAGTPAALPAWAWGLTTLRFPSKKAYFVVSCPANVRTALKIMPHVATWYRTESAGLHSRVDTGPPESPDRPHRISSIARPGWRSSSPRSRYGLVATTTRTC
ncbi:unnamed protein product, partial [Ectocarpus sp. 4 AP-2014]